jgi:hypothetical protein
LGIKLSDLPLSIKKQILKQDRPHKYNAKKTVVDGIKFASQKEANYYQKLKLRKRIGEIKDFELQPSFLLQRGFFKNGKRYRAIEYIADFKVIYPDDRIEIIDCKGESRNQRKGLRLRYGSKKRYKKRIQVCL